MKTVTVNSTKRLYVIHCGDGYSTLGFDYTEKQRLKVLKWLKEPCEPMELGTLEHYEAYRHAMELGRAHYAITGKRCNAELDERLTPYLHKWVMVVDQEDPTKVQVFKVGKSTGWMPIYLEIESDKADGGGGCYLPKKCLITAIEGSGEKLRKMLEGGAQCAA